MGFMDKAKEVMDKIAGKVKDPDGSLVERTWPAAEPPVAEDDDGTNHIQGADPELDVSPEDQYDEER
ncbi:hypothetical protein OK351_09635 [Glutamicibacter sp. MNS18]|uniref:hypothetical protein n=1 Tax=Glutamicibacter sp. MNS18 TaxID=2989817 RepID=UPI00223580C4|nr:hypothetical protein [Glutamicibacter sp. MNS18]MCW4465768.1 hypothetical protein [Glutamicibacter sp. MNS18]